MHDQKWKSALRRKLLKWFDETQRDLPWRQNKTPYRIWVSEIMLQQTQVATVVGYYQKFMTSFPTIAKLASATESDVLKHWEGLGYYRRARQLHAAAKIVMEQHGGIFPESFADVLALPGVGRYTAGAILSISLDQQQPILEGNTIRLFARLMVMKSDPRSSSNQKALWEFSESILPRKRCGDFNQALMELGSEICHPQRPKCLLCPIQSLCPTSQQGLTEQVPLTTKKVKYESINEAVVLIERKGKYLVRKCLPGERWAGLWDFPRYEMATGAASANMGLTTTAGPSKTGSKAKALANLKPEHPLACPTTLPKILRDDTGLQCSLELLGKRFKHAVTRFRITLDCFVATSVTGRLRATLNGEELFRWMTRAEIEAAAMSITGRKVAKLLR